MILLAAEAPELEPIYTSQYTGCATIWSASEVILAPNEIKLISTGLRIRGVVESQLVPGIIPEIQVRTYPGIEVALVGGLLTVDANHLGEIIIPLINTSAEEYTVHRLDRIAKITLGLRGILPGIRRLEAV